MAIGEALMEPLVSSIAARGGEAAISARLKGGERVRSAQSNRVVDHCDTVLSAMSSQVEISPMALAA